MEVIEIIRLIGSEFYDTPDGMIEKWIEFQKPFVSKKMFGDLYERALALLVCHSLKMSTLGDGDDGIGGMSVAAMSAMRAGISSISDGGSSISFNAGDMSAAVDSMYSKTVYGQQFLALRRMAVVPITISD